MRNLGPAITVAVLLFLFTSFPMAFSQQPSSDFFVGTSSETINPSETVSVTISIILGPNSTRDVMLRFVSPQGSVQPYQLHLRADSLGFASGTVEYPNGVANASTQQPGNYTVFVQDVQTATLGERASFEVVRPANSQGFPDLNSAVIFPGIVLGIGAALTYFYNSRAQKRQTKVILNQKKAEFLVERFTIWEVIMDAAEDIARYLKPFSKNLPKGDGNDENIKRDCRLAFYHLILYHRAYTVQDEKIGWYFLSDPRGERLVIKVAGNISNRLRDKLDLVDQVAFGRMLSEQQTFTDLENELTLSSTAAYNFYGKFESWIRDNQESEEIQKFICDLDLLFYLLSYEIQKMVEDWYPKKEGVNQILLEYRKKITWIYDHDGRYESEKYPEKVRVTLRDIVLRFLAMISEIWPAFSGSFTSSKTFNMIRLLDN
jgi:hypothetical protein